MKTLGQHFRNATLGAGHGQSPKARPTCSQSNAFGPTAGASTVARQKCPPCDVWSASTSAATIIFIAPHASQRHWLRDQAIEKRASATAQVDSRTEIGEPAMNATGYAYSMIRTVIAPIWAHGPFRLALARVPRRSWRLRDSRECGVFVAFEHLTKSMRQAEERRKAGHREIIHFRKNLLQGSNGGNSMARLIYQAPTDDPSLRYTGRASGSTRSILSICCRRRQIISDRRTSNPRHRRPITGSSAKR